MVQYQGLRVLGVTVGAAVLASRLLRRIPRNPCRPRKTPRSPVRQS
jgi:hypothetical protein